MSSLRCKRCGNPVSDAYSKWGYCAVHGKEKQRLDNLDVFFRAFSIICLAPILAAVVFALVGINSSLTLFYFIIWQALLTVSSMIAFSINRYFINHFDHAA